MKKLFILLMLVSTGITSYSQKTWEFSYLSEGHLHNGDEWKGLMFTTPENSTYYVSKGWKIANRNNPDFPESYYYQYIKQTGEGAANRNISFNVDGPCTIEVVASTASKEYDCLLHIDKNEFGNTIDTMSFRVNDKFISRVFEYKGESATLILYGEKKINIVGIYVIPAGKEMPDMPELKYDKSSGLMTIIAKNDVEVYYTTDKTPPTVQSIRYTGPFEVEEYDMEDGISKYEIGTIAVKNGVQSKTRRKNGPIK